MRLFVAVIPPEHVLEDLGDFLEPRREAGPELRWTDPNQWHLTLSFMGEVPERTVEPLVERLAARATRFTAETVSIAGMHCESGDVLIDDVALPPPRRGDLLAVPAAGAYTLAMSSTYNGVGRPGAVLVRDGDARLVRRRETVDDLLALEAR